MSKYNASTMVQLPRLKAVGAMALGEQLLSAARPHLGVLSPGVARMLDALTARHKELSEVLRDQVTPEEESVEDTVACDRRLDGCWSGFSSFLSGFTKLPSQLPQVAEAAALQAAILPGGLMFLTFPYPVQWSESELRLQRIQKNGLGARIEALGGKVILDAIMAAHAAYGQALGITTAPAALAPVTSGARIARDAFADALRAYVIKVMGAVEPDEPETQVLADRLLAPLSSWSVGPMTRSHVKTPPVEAELPSADIYF